jgi:predicted acyl esterase
MTSDWGRDPRLSSDAQILGTRDDAAVSRVRRASLAVAWALLVAPGTAVAASAPDEGAPFRPGPVSEPQYGIAAPASNPDLQVHRVLADDGVEIVVQTILPTANGGQTPPRRLPTVLLATPYAPPQIASQINNPITRYFVERGYAHSIAMIRGTGLSSGCFDYFSQRSIDDIAAVVEYLGRDAPWSNGRVGMFGRSYAADIQIAVAGRGDPAQTKYLDAIVPIAPVNGEYDIAFEDGVPVGHGVGFGIFAYNHLLGFEGGGVSTNRQDLSCVPEQSEALQDTSGSMTPFWREREYSHAARKVRAPVLLADGLADEQPDPHPFFNRLPKRLPKAAIYGWWEHNDPGAESRPHRFRPEWARADWLPTATAWFDRFLKGLRNVPTGRWPTVQVQRSDGQWRSQRSWPAASEREGRLWLDEDERLVGRGSLEGESTYSEALGPGTRTPGASVAFETEPLPGRLEITGTPTLDLWVSLSKPDAHVAASLEVRGRGGELLEDVPHFALRSAQHLAPLKGGRVRQDTPIPAPTGEPFRLSASFDATDLVVPKGGTVRVEISGSVRTKNHYYFGHDNELIQAYGTAFYFSEPSGAEPLVTVHHDCARHSVLRFALPPRRQRLLNVREYDESEPPVRNGAAVRKVGSTARGLVTPSPREAPCAS